MKLGILIASLVLSYFFYTEVVGQASPHLLAENCQGCHLAKSNITSDNASLLINSQEILCDSCHVNASSASHPSGFAPNRKLPDIYKLDWQGNITCSTCHNIHATDQGLMVTKLRGKDFCHSCHDESFFRNMKDSGASLFVSGHTVPDDVSDGEQVDAFSAKCMECHANEQSNLNVAFSNTGIVSHSGSRVNHPIGKDYREAARFGGYRPFNQLDKRISLPNGRLSCISCHKAYDGKHGADIMSNDYSNLCFHCHDL